MLLPARDVLPRWLHALSSNLLLWLLVRNRAGTLPVSLAAVGSRSNDFCWSFWLGNSIVACYTHGMQSSGAPRWGDSLAARWVLRDGEGDAHPSVPMGFPGGIGGGGVWIRGLPAKPFAERRSRWPLCYK